MKNNRGMTLIETLVALVIATMILSILTSGILTASSWNEEAENTKRDGEAVADAADGTNAEGVSIEHNAINGIQFEAEEETMAVGGNDGVNSNSVLYEYSRNDSSAARVETNVLQVSAPTDDEGEITPEEDDSFIQMQNYMQQYQAVLSDYLSVNPGILDKNNSYNKLNNDLINQLSANGMGNQLDAQYLKEHGIYTAQTPALYIKVLVVNKEPLIFASIDQDSNALNKVRIAMIYSGGWYVAPRQSTTMSFCYNISVDNKANLKGTRYTTAYLTGQFMDGYYRIDGNVAEENIASTSSLGSVSDVISYVTDPTSGWTKINANP